MIRWSPAFTAVLLLLGAGGISPAPGTGAGDASFTYPFACDLFRTVGDSGGNLLLSPHAISLSLAIVRAGAAGETAKQMDTLLRFPADAPAAFREIDRALPVSAPEAPAAPDESRPEKAPPSNPGVLLVEAIEEPAEFSLTLARGLFGPGVAELREGFRRDATENFAADLHALDFDRPDEARSAMNRWVEEKTAGRITEIAPAGFPAPETRLVLASAIHFKASWDHPFDESATVDGPFRVAAGKVVTAKRMRQTERLSYGETREARLLELPYRLGHTAMIIVLPRSKDGLDPLVRGLTAGKIRRWIAAMEGREVSLELPKFTFSSELDLSAALERLGMADAFSLQAADFSGMTSGKPLFIGAVLHKGFVTVDEKGTEAAALALGVVAAGGGGNEPVPFVVDHPFLFLIRHSGTGAVLFIGRVVDPTAT